MIDGLLRDRTLAGGRWLGETTSTNTVLLAEDTPTPYLLGADVQTAGRGRPGKSWVSSEGSLTFSLAVSGPAYALSCGLAICEAIDQLTPEASRAEIKWPNDVLMGGRKVAGILIERHHERAVIGVGLNVNNAAPEGGTSLSKELGYDCDRTIVLAAVVTQLLRLGQCWDDEILGSLRSRDALLGRQVVTSSLTGRAGGITERGELIVEGQFVSSGSVRVVE